MLAPNTLLRFEKILLFEINATIDAFRRDECLSHFAGRREILNDNFLYIWIYKMSIDLNTFTELLI